LGLPAVVVGLCGAVVCAKGVVETPDVARILVRVLVKKGVLEIKEGLLFVP